MRFERVRVDAVVVEEAVKTAAARIVSDDLAFIVDAVGKRYRRWPRGVDGHTANVCVVMRDSVASDRGPIPAIRLSPGRKRDGRKYGTPSRRWAGLKPASSSTATSRCELRASMR